MDYALFLLGRKRYTKNELLHAVEKRCAKKFGKECEKSCCGEIAAKIIERIKELKYINDEEYIEDFVGSRLRLRPKGVKALKYELKKKGIEKADIEKYFGENLIDEESAAARIALEKLKRLGRFPEEKKRAKIIMMLNSRGFNAHVIYETINKIFNQ